MTNQRKNIFQIPTTDFSFKKIFGTERNKRFLIRFLNCFVSKYTGEIVDVTYLPTEHYGMVEAEKKAVFDLLCKDAEDRQFVIEMQKAPQPDYAERSIFYLSRAISASLKRGQLDYEILPSYSVNILDFDLQEYRKKDQFFHADLPADYDETDEKTYPAVTVAHPNGGCKEQVAGLYAQKHAERGFITLACDASYQGESGGEPRLRDYPANRIDDISGMVDYLSQLPNVDSARIGSLGICGGGGYTLACAQTDKRIRAVATLSMFNSGRVRRNGFLDADKAGAKTRLQRAAEARQKLLAGEVVYEGFLPPDKTDDELRSQMLTLPENTLYRDGIEYYGLTHRHPNATGSYTTESFSKLIAFDTEDRMELIDQPLLMVCGEKADTLYMSEDAFSKATGTENKELYLIPGASHIRTYWVEEYVSQAVEKLAAFFGENL